MKELHQCKQMVSHRDGAYHSPVKVISVLVRGTLEALLYRTGLRIDTD